MKIIDLLLAFGLLTAILSGLYSVLLRWLRTPVRVTAKSASVNKRTRNHRALRTPEPMRQGAASHAFSR